MLAYFLVALGGALGSAARYWLSGFVGERSGETFPWGTLVVNVSGSLVIGCLATLTAPEGRWLATPNTRVFLIYGLCGGYTTFSSFSLQTFELLREGDWLKAAANVLASVLLCLAGVWLGHILVQALTAPRGHQ